MFITSSLPSGLLLPACVLAVLLAHNPKKRRSAQVMLQAQNPLDSGFLSHSEEKPSPGPQGFLVLLSPHLPPQGLEDLSRLGSAWRTVVHVSCAFLSHAVHNTVHPDPACPSLASLQLLWSPCCSSDTPNMLPVQALASEHPCAPNALP